MKHKTILFSVAVAALLCALAAGCKRKQEATSPAPPEPATEETGKQPEPAMMTVKITHEEVSVDGAKVVSLHEGTVNAEDKRDGVSGFFINPLYQSLFDAMKKMKMLRKYNPDAVAGMGRLRIVADYRTRYRTLCEVMYTAGQAEYSRIKLAVEKDGSMLVKNGSVDIGIPKYEEMSPAKQAEKLESAGAAPLNLTVSISNLAFHVVVSGEKKSFPKVKSEYDYGALSKGIVEIKKQHETEDQITVVAEDDVPCDILAGTLNAVLWDGERRLFEVVVFATAM